MSLSFGSKVTPRDNAWLLVPAQYCGHGLPGLLGENFLTRGETTEKKVLPEGKLHSLEMDTDPGLFMRCW